MEIVNVNHDFRDQGTYSHVTIEMLLQLRLYYVHRDSLTSYSWLTI